MNLLNLIYPRVCLQCGIVIQEKGFGRPEVLETGDDSSLKRPHDFCPPCWESIPRLEGPSCPVCASPLASEAALSHSPGHRCGDCRENPPAFSFAVTPFAYEGALAKAIHSFKYQKQSRLAAPLTALFIDDLSPLQIDTVMAIPLHHTRLRKREFNQSLLLAKEVSRLLALPLHIDAMKRIRKTPPQVGLSKTARKKNIHRAFEIRQPEFIQDQRILLIDDVYTTGTTLREGAKTLIQGGAKNVVVAALARMMPNS